jgi:hypothetical protein
MAEAPARQPAEHAARDTPSAADANTSDRRAPDGTPRTRGTNRVRDRSCIRVAILPDRFAASAIRCDVENRTAHNEKILA